MHPVYIASDNIISPLGFSTYGNYIAMIKGETGIRTFNDGIFLPKVISASLINNDDINVRFSSIGHVEKYTRFEKLALLSVKYCLEETDINVSDEKTLFILSTTKGSIDVLENDTKVLFDENRLMLWKSAQIISEFFGNPVKPVVVSCACVSGVVALITAANLIRSGKYDNIVVTGADILTRFVASGFSSFMALSDSPCKPFDKNRNGLNIGEAAGTIILTKNRTSVNRKKIICIGSGFSANDANHISAPSRTGEGLYKVISKIVNDTSIISNKKSIDFISAHGTATVYNDDMEATAITRAGMENIPLNSFKGYWGHTLGAAGIIESVATVQSMKENKLVKTAGLTEPGTTSTVNVLTENKDKEINTCLKLASGFGGTNAGLILYNCNE